MKYFTDKADDGFSKFDNFKLLLIIVPIVAIATMSPIIFAGVLLAISKI